MRSGFRNSVKLAHLNKSGVWPSGNPRLYFRPKGQKGVALPDRPTDSPDFLAAYAKAAGLSKPPRATHRTGTLGAAIRAYLKSDAHLSLAISTRVLWRPFLDRIDEKYGHVSFHALQSKHIRADLKELRPHPTNSRLKVWRRLCRWAHEVELIEDDPAAAVSPKKIPKTDGHASWTREDVKAFRQHWPKESPQRLAFELMFWTGSRISDAVRFSTGMVDGEGWLEYRQQKTGGFVSVPFYAPAPAFSEQDGHLKEALEARPQRHLVFMVTSHGKPRSSKGASFWFAAAAKASGVKGKTAHGLRKLRAGIMAENGATVHQIGAWTGHETLAEVQRYAQKASKRRIISGTQSSNSSEPVPTFGHKAL